MLYFTSTTEHIEAFQKGAYTTLEAAEAGAALRHAKMKTIACVCFIPLTLGAAWLVFRKGIAWHPKLVSRSLVGSGMAAAAAALYFHRAQRIAEKRLSPAMQEVSAIYQKVAEGVPLLLQQLYAKASDDNTTTQEWYLAHKRMNKIQYVRKGQVEKRAFERLPSDVQKLFIKCYKSVKQTFQEIPQGPHCDTVGFNALKAELELGEFNGKSCLDHYQLNFYRPIGRVIN